MSDSEMSDSEMIMSPESWFLYADAICNVATPQEVTLTGWPTEADFANRKWLRSTPTPKTPVLQALVMEWRGICFTLPMD